MDRFYFIKPKIFLKTNKDNFAMVIVAKKDFFIKVRKRERGPTQQLYPEQSRVDK